MEAIAIAIVQRETNKETHMLGIKKIEREREREIERERMYKEG